MTGTTDRYSLRTAVTVSVNPGTPDMQVVDLGHVDLSEGSHRLVSLSLGLVDVLVSSNKVDVLDRLVEMVAEARALLAEERVSS